MDGNFRPGDLGWLIGEMVGGPLDGRRYRDLPMVPDGAPSQISIPLGDPTTGPRAVYERRDTAPTAQDVWLYDFVPNPGLPLTASEKESEPVTGS